MLIYSVIMLATAALLLAFGLAIYKGKTNLIHSYHQTKVADKTAYGKAFGKALFVFASGPLCSGIIGLLSSSDTMTMISVAVLIAGMGIGIGCIAAVQRKYNKGIF